MDAVDRIAELAWARYAPVAPAPPAAPAAPEADPVDRCIAALFRKCEQEPVVPVVASVVAASDSEEEDDGQEPGARVDGRRENRGRKARSTILLAEKLRWIGRVEAQLLLTPAPAHSHSLKDGRLARAVRATLEAHDKPWVIGEAGRVGKDGRGGEGALRGGAEHYKWTRAILRWLKQAPLLRAQDRRHKLCQVLHISFAPSRWPPCAPSQSAS
jgi:hypothetical protein